MHLRALLISSFTASAAIGQTLYVDTNGTASGFGTEASANWGDSIWKYDTNGTSSTIGWVSGSIASFGTGFSTRNLSVNLGSTDYTTSGLIFHDAVTITSAGGSLTNSGNLTVSGGGNGTIAANLNIGANQLTHSNSATLTLSGSNTVGSVRVSNSGTLRAGSVGAFGTGTVTVQSGSLNLDGHNVAAQVLTGSLTNANVTNAQNYSGTVLFRDHVSGSLDGYASPNPTANGVFPTANLVLSTGVSLRYQTSGSILLEHSSAELRLSTFNNTSNTIGALTVNAGNVYTDGPVSGVLDTLSVNGDLNLNSSSYTAFDGSTQTGTSSLYFQLSNTGNSMLTVTGTAYLAGNLFVNGMVNEARTFDLITASSFVGAFDSISLPTLPEGLEWDTSQLNTAGRLSLVAIPEPSAFAALAGLAALSLATLRRRRS